MSYQLHRTKECTTFIDITGKKKKKQTRKLRGKKKVGKGAWRMPRLSEAKKDVISCEKLRGFANKN